MSSALVEVTVMILVHFKAVLITGTHCFMKWFSAKWVKWTNSVLSGIHKFEKTNFFSKKNKFLMK